MKRKKQIICLTKNGEIKILGKAGSEFDGSYHFNFKNDRGPEIREVLLNSDYLIKTGFNGELMNNNSFIQLGDGKGNTFSVSCHLEEQGPYQGYFMLSVSATLLTAENLAG